MRLVKGERIMTDGTLFQANASLDSLISKDEIKKEYRDIKTRIRSAGIKKS